MACWHCSWHETHPPASARLRRTERKATYTPTAAAAAPPSTMASDMIRPTTLNRCAVSAP